MSYETLVHRLEQKMGRPRADAHQIPTPERILRAAEVTFGAQTFADASLAEIAAAAKVRRPSLLYHFSSKELLYNSVVERLFSDLFEQIATAGQGSHTPAQTIEALFQAWVDFLAARPAFAPLLLRGIIDGQGPVRERLEQQLVPLLVQLETYIQAAGAAPAELSVRAALLQIGTDSLVRASSGPLAGPLWGDVDSMGTVRRLFQVGTELHPNHPGQHAH